jgi:hypothetical protein
VCRNSEGLGILWKTFKPILLVETIINKIKEVGTVHFNIDLHTPLTLLIIVNMFVLMYRLSHSFKRYLFLIICKHHREGRDLILQVL